ncbi:histidinol-phosphate transaminase [Immundisolibacter sp.]|uniref:histidinol-phosphate transaminase n=1 Tax=Immundisolibacter sp. TaxID=1934948 RepID=UPI002616C740|nr:histidinol-phosphate transaminase [Immundisolibacter sp.]MDD3651003.1 histidinol-phosphate transaminase [Immundisolibacter sp.]
MNRLDAVLRPQIRALCAYHVPPAAGLLKLDAMENPYPWPGELAQAWLESLRGVGLNRYPLPHPHDLLQALARQAGVPPGCELLLGNGSDELIQLIDLCVARPGASVLLPTPTFSMYSLIAQVAGLEVLEVPLRADFDLDLPAMLAAIEQHRPALIYLACPNNPTAGPFDIDAMRAVIAAAPGLVVVDEAYFPFAGRSVLPWLLEFEHLLVLRTLSKVGLAGLRLGYLVGHTQWLREFDKARLPYNINTLTQRSALFALAHADRLAGEAARICADRERLGAGLAALPGVTVYPSATNFILLRLPAGRATAAHEALQRAGILVKNVHGSHPLLADCLRVTVGAAAENDALLAALAAHLTGTT